jgi:tetratricopeptide (TPR) repeat protein
LAERGRALAASADDLVRLGLLRAGILRELGRTHEAMQAFREVALATTDDAAQCKAWIGVASCVRLLGGNDEGIAALMAAEPLAQRHQAHRELSDIHYYFGSLLFTAGDIDGCLRHHGQAHDFALKARDAECEARALSGLGDAHYARGHMRLAIDHFHRCKALCRDRGFGRIEAGSTHMIGAIRRYLFEWREAVEDLREAAATAAKLGNIRTQMAALNILGEVLVDAGRSGEARQALAEALRLAETFDNPRFRAYVLCELGRAHIYDAASKDDAQAVLDEALALSRQTGMRFVGPRVLAALALVSDQRRSVALAEGESIIRSGCLAHNALWFYRDATEAHLMARDFDRARSCASALAEITSSDPLPWSDFFIDRGRALADHASGKRDRALFENLLRLRQEAERAGLNASIPAISSALADKAVD